MYSTSSRFSDQYSGVLSLPTRLRNFLPDSLFQVACDLQAMSDVIDAKLEQEITLSQGDVHCYEDKFAAAQHGLVNFPFTQSGVDNIVTYHRQNCWRNAAFIFLNTVIRGTPGKSLIDLATDRLLDSLQKSDLQSEWSVHKDVLLWVLFICWNGAFGNAVKNLLSIQFQQLIRDMGLSSFEQTRRILQQHVWRDSSLDKPLRDIWNTATSVS